MAHLRECPCGSGKYPERQYDARNIYLCYTCSKCHEEKMAGYRQEVLEDCDYEASEPIEAEDDFFHLIG